MTAPSQTVSPKMAAMVVASSNFMGSLDTTIITLAMPQMAESFGVRPLEVTIGITIYIVVMAIVLPASAWIADRFGPRRVLIAAILGFTGASVLCGLSGSLGMFVASRALQAACAALMSPVGNQILFRVTPKKDFVTAVAISTTPALVAPVIGPPLGGFIITALDWPWIFFLNVPIGLIGVALTLRAIPHLDRGEPRPFDWTGFALCGVALSCLIYGLEEASAEGVGLASVGLVAAGSLLGFAALRHVRRAEHPIFSLAPLRIRTFVVSALTGGGVARIPMRGINLILPLMMQGPLGLNAFQSGVLLLGYNGGDLALKALAGRIIRRWGFRISILLSGVLTGAATVLLAFVSPATPWMALLALLVACGALRSVMFTGQIALTFADVPPEEVAHASVLSNVGAQVISAFAVSFTALLLSGSAAMRGAGEAIGLVDYRVAIVVMALLWAVSGALFGRLPANAGAEVSGHRRGRA